MRFSISPHSHSLNPSTCREHETIENVLVVQDKYLPADIPAYLESIRAARAIFLSLPTLPPGISLEATEPDPLLHELLREWGILRRTDEVEATTADASEEDLDAAIEREALRMEEVCI